MDHCLITTVLARRPAVFRAFRGIVELTATITWEICAAKFNRALEIEGQGIGAVCPLPRA